MKEFDYSWDDQDPEQISDLVEGEYDRSLEVIESHELEDGQDEDLDNSGLCSCGDGGKQRECEDCKHALDCSESYCDNEEHQRVVDFGYPESCTCSQHKTEDTCLGCGHKNSCASEQEEFCFTEPHSGLLVFLHYRQDCDCQDSRAAQQCPTCEHKSACRDAIGRCRQVGYHLDEGSRLDGNPKLFGKTGDVQDFSTVSDSINFTSQGVEKWSQFLIHKIGSHMEEDARRIPAQEVGRISSLPAEFWNRWIRQVIIYDPDCKFEFSLIGELAASKPKPWYPLAHLDFSDFSPSTREAVLKLSGPGMDAILYKLTNPIAQKIKEREQRSHAVHLICSGDASDVSDALVEAKFVFNTSAQEWALDISNFARGKTLEELLVGLKNSNRAWVKAVERSDYLQLTINYMGKLHEVPL